MRRSARLRYMTDPNPEGTPGAQPPAKTFTQDDVTAIATRNAEDGRRSALREVTEKLGGLSVDDAAALIDAARKADEANKTEAQRALDAAAADRAAAAKEKEDAAKDRHAARVERLLTGAVDVQIAARSLDVEVGADEDTIKAEIEKLKAKVPGLFGAAPAPSTDPGKPPAGAPVGKTAAERAAAIAAQRGYTAA